MKYIIYCSYTNNVERIVNELRTQIEVDVIEVEPAGIRNVCQTAI